MGYIVFIGVFSYLYPKHTPDVNDFQRTLTIVDFVEISTQSGFGGCLRTRTSREMVPSIGITAIK